MALKNPFAPTFGASPPVLAGREDILADIADALDTGPTHPDYTTLFIGVRGAGKTSMLNAVENLAHERGWLTISVDTTTTGLIARLTDAAAQVAASLSDPKARTRLGGVKIMGSGVDLAREPAAQERPKDLRALLGEITDRLSENETGLLITIDELHTCDLEEVREFGAVLQHVSRREGRSVAFAGAGLAQIEDTLLSDDAATFLQRCARIEVDRLEDAAVAQAIAQPIEERAGTIDPEALAQAVAATSGYAFMVQLVGFYTWKAASDPTVGVTAADVASGIYEAEKRIGRLVLAPTWKGLSDVDRRFLLAMARDEGPSLLTAIAARLDCDTNYAGVYRHRLIKAGMIVAPQRGKVDFAHHATRGWLRAEAAYAGVTFADE